MKQTNTFSVVLSLVFCVLIGYFEPANAQSSNNILVMAPNAKVAQAYPNPVSGNDMMTASLGNVTSATLMSFDGTLNAPCVVENFWQFEPIVLVNIGDDGSGDAGLAENNWQFEPIILKNFSLDQIAKLSYADIQFPDGVKSGASYYLLVQTDNGSSYYSTITMQ